MQIIRRKDAAMAGLRRYFTGKECVAGHTAARYVSSGACTECLKQHQLGTRALQTAVRKSHFSRMETYFLRVPASTDKTLLKTMMESLGFECISLAEARKAEPMQFREWLDDGKGTIYRYDVHTGRRVLKINPDGSSELPDGTPGPQYAKPPITGSGALATYGPPEDFDPRR